MHCIHAYNVVAQLSPTATIINFIISLLPLVVDQLGLRVLLATQSPVSITPRSAGGGGGGGVLWRAYAH